MSYKIDADVCIACGVCEPVCPVGCISETGNGKRVIDEETCIDCTACVAVCPVGCIAPAE